MKNFFKKTAAFICMLGLAGSVFAKESLIDLLMGRNDFEEICRMSTIECRISDAIYGTKTEKVMFKKVTATFMACIEIIVEMGIDLDEIEIDENPVNIIVTVPKAHVLSAQVNSESLENNIKVSKSRFVKITNEDLNVKIAESVEKAKEMEKEDTINLKKAQKRAGDKLYEYITRVYKDNNINKTVTIKYK